MSSAFAAALVSPLGTALALGGLALGAGALRRRRLSAAAGLVALLWLALWSTPALSRWLRSSVENEYPPLAVQALPAAPALVVLGGAMSPADARRPLPDMGAAADRVWHAARLYHAGKAPLLVLSGGSDPRVSATSEAAAMALLLHDLGVPASALVLEEQSRDTEQNARYCGELLRQRGIASVLLVTSALHMHRARQAFEAVGLRVLPAATDYEVSSAAGWHLWLPSSAALDGSARAFKELAGRWTR